MQILYAGEEPAGVVRSQKDEYEGRTCASIGPSALKPEYQGRGLGRALLRAAVALYLKEGFRKSLSYVCYGRIFPEQPRNST